MLSSLLLVELKHVNLIENILLIIKIVVLRTYTKFMVYLTILAAHDHYNSFLLGIKYLSTTDEL